MSKRPFIVVAGVICLGLLGLEQVKGADPLQLGGTALDSPYLAAPSISLGDTQRFFFSTSFGLIQPTSDFLPTFNPVQPWNGVPSNVPRYRDSKDSAVDLRSPSQIYVGGEIGFLYGRSTGKYGVEYEGGYVIGELGNNWFHLTVGTSYERTNWRVPRSGR